MDPKDPNNGGLQAKDQKGAKGDTGKKPGKVANTDQYGHGGAGGETATPGKKSGTEHLPEGRNGKESKAAINEAAGKSNPPTVMGPVQLPPGKEPTGAPKKPEKKGAAKAKGNGNLEKKKKKSGDTNHAAAVVPATDAAGVMAFTPRTSEPAKVSDVPVVSPFEPVVVQALASGKPQPSHELLRAEVTALTGQIKTAQDEILALSKSLEKTVAAQLQEYAGAIDQRVQAGTERVGTAYNGLSRAVNDQVAKANETITKREQSIPAHVKQVRDAKADELKALVTKVKTDTSNAITKGPEALAARKAAKDFATKLDAISVTLIADIKKKTTAGGELAKGLDPKEYSNEVQFGGEGARAIGHKALVDDKRLSLITTAGKQAIGLIEGTIKEVSKGYREESDAHLTEALKGPDGELDKVITQVHEPEQQKHLDAAAKVATETLQKQAATSRAGIAKVQKDATTRIASERRSAEAGAKQAGKALSDNIKHGSKEIENRIATKAAQDAAGYNKLNAELKKIGKSKKLDAATKARLDTMKADLGAAREQHKTMLNELATTSVADLKRDKEAQYEKAISGYEAAAGTTKQELVGKMTTAISQLGQSFDTIGTSFDATVSSETAKMKIEFDFYTKQAHELPDTLSKKFERIVTQTEAGLRAGTAAMLEQETVQAKLNKKSEPAIIAAKKKCEDGAHAIWDAMDGAGTDENKIFGALRTATPGEIVYIEGEYNAAYPKRGTRRYPSPIRADLDDELSGSEWDIAFSYLRHQRERALKLELDDSRGIFNDEEERIQEVLKAASDEELKNILTSDDGKAVMENVKGCLSGCDLDVVNALTEMDAKTGMPVADRKVKADAILIYQAMYGGTGIGTEEDKIKKILEETTDPAQRKLLHEKYAEYIRKKDPLQAYKLEQQAGKGADLMDASIDDEMSGGEWTETRAMSEHQLSQDDHLKLVKMAKVVDGAHGAGTDEDKIVDNIETDDAYFEKYQAEKDPQKRKLMAEGREKAMNARLRWLEGERVDENGQPLKDQDGNPIAGKGPNVMTSRFKGESITQIIKGEMGSEDITFEEMQQQKWGPYPDRGEKNGQKVETGMFQRRARMGALNLEYMVAQRKLQAGGVDPELLIAYACWGVNGTNETNLKKGLKKGGELRTKADIQDLRNKFKAIWGVDLMDGLNEIERKDFKQPTGTVPSEVDGKDWLEIRISLMGKPETPQEIAYVDNVRYKFVTSGTGNTSPFSHAREDMEVNHQRIQDECAKAVAENKPLNSFDATKAKKPERKDFKTDEEFSSAEDKFYESAAATEGLYLEGNRLEILAGYAERSEMAFLTAKEAMADAIITVIELIGAALITAASMGAASPMLAMFIGNLILAGMTIMMRKDMVGDAYGSEEIGIDVIKGIVMAGIQAAGEAKVVANFAKKAGQYGGAFARVFTGGAEKAGMRVVGKEGLEIAEQAALRLEAKVGAKMATEGGEKAAVAAGTKEVAEKVVTKEAGDVGEKVATKEAGDLAEKAATKEAGDVAEKVATKEATEVGEKVAAKEGAAAAKKTTAEHVEAGVESGVKNVATTVMSDTAQFLMDEKTWEMKGFDAMFGPQSLGRKLLNSIPSAFVQGAVSEYIQSVANVPTHNKARGPSSGSEAVFRRILSEAAGNTAGFFVYLDNYGDAGTFWQELFKSNIRSIASAGMNGYFGHAMRAPKLGRDAFAAFKDGDQKAFHEALAGIQEADGYMDTAEKQRVVDRIMQEPIGPEVLKHLPESFQKLASKQKQAGGSVTGPGGDTAPQTQKVPVEEKKPANEQKVAAAPEAKKPAAVDADPNAHTKKSDAQDNADPTKSGAKSAANNGKQDDGRTDANLAGNETTVSPHIAGRAKSTLDAMSTSDRKAVQEVMDLAKTPGQKSMLEKAVAAGRNPRELEILRAAMAGMNDVDIAKTFSGAGVIQFFHQSCAPTAYQIAIADVDPYFAFYLRQHPELVMDAQSNALIIHGGAQTPREDLNSDKKDPAKNLQPHLDDQSMNARLGDKESYSDEGHKGGIAMPDLDGSNLHKQLEKATGLTYEVVTNETVPFKNKGAGQYNDSTAPHDRIIAAVQAGHPVIVGQYLPGMGGGHAMVIVGVEIQGTGPNRVITYKVRDPMSGTIAPIPQFLMDRYGTQGFTLPKVPAPKVDDDAAPVHKQQGADASKDAGADEKSTKAGTVGADKDPTKTWEDTGKQTEKPDPESFTDAHTRRSKPITPGKDAADAVKWASPDNRQAIAETVPLSRQEVRDIVMAKYGATLEPYINRQKTADDAFLPLIEKLRNEEPGAGKTAEGRKRQEDYEKEWDRISAEVAKKEDRHDDSELRTFYNVVEKEDFKHIWAPAIAHLPLEQQARLMHMYREELKIMVRDLMSDENSKEVLYLRDRFGSGDRRGARFEDLVDRNMPKAKGDENEAMKMVIASSMRSNEKINLAKTGYADGIVPEVGNKIRGETKDPAKEIENVRAKNAATLESEHSKVVSGSAGAGVTSLDDDVVPHAKLQQEASETRRKEINLADNKPMVRLEGEPKDVRRALDHLWEHREELKSLAKKDPNSDRVKELKRDIADAEKQLAEYLNDPANKDNLLNPHVAFALAREASANKSPDLTGFVRKHVDEFRKAQDQARQGADPQLRAKRELFEREIAKAIMSGPLMKQVNADLDMMCKKALDYISKLPEDRQAKFLAALGAQADGGYAGAVLKGSHVGQNAMVMADVLLEGNIRERMMTLGNFATAVAADMHANAKDFENVKKQAGGASPDGFGADEVARYEARMAEYRRDQEKKKVDASPTNDRYASDFLKPTNAEKSGDQLGYQTLKNQEMDAKLPSLPTDASGVFHNQLPQSPSAKVKQGETGAGEASSLARQGMTVKEAQRLGYNLSQREIDAAGGPDGVLPWLTGTIANVVDPSAGFIKEGAEASLPQKAGISGTTFRFMEASALLGGNPKMARLAAIGALQMIDAHTIYEIAHASKGFGLEFDPKRPYDHLGIDPELLAQIALSTGTTYAELNGETTAAPATPKE